MDLLTALHERVQALIDGEISPEDLNLELAGAVPEAARLADVGKRGALQLIGHLVGVINDYSEGFIDEADLNQALRETTQRVVIDLTAIDS